jgi:hypothetical protein
LPKAFWPETLALAFQVQLVGHQWLTPIILAIQEAEIKKTVVQRQPGKIVLKTLSQKRPIHTQKVSVNITTHIFYPQFFL